MQQQGEYLERAMMGINLYGESLPGLPLVEVVGKCRVLIENHCGVNCYTDCEVHINSQLGVIKVTGDKLLLAKVAKECLVIKGAIHTVSFLY